MYFTSKSKSILDTISLSQQYKSARYKEVLKKKFPREKEGCLINILSDKGKRIPL